MTDSCWTHQKTRLIDRFGERNFSKEFSLLVAIECKSMPDQTFVDMVNAMIGARRPNDPPLLSHFRDARLALERRQLERDLYGATKTLTQPGYNQGLKNYLANEFPGCKNLWEAVEVRKLQIQIAKANGHSYDPLKDLKWS